MKTRYTVLFSLVVFLIPISQAKADEKQSDETAKKRTQVELIELENTLNRAKLEKELAALQSEVQRLMLEKERVRLQEELEREKNLQAYEKEMLGLRQQKEKLQVEIELSRAKIEKSIEKFRQASTALANKVELTQRATEQLQADMAQRLTQQQHDRHAVGKPVYLKKPLQKDGTLVISDRQIALNGLITDWKANYITDCVQYFNNKDPKLPIFLVIGSSPGGDAMAGMRILKTIKHSQAPVYVVVKSFAASMAACITTLATKSYAYSNAVILHHQPWAPLSGTKNLREQKEIYEASQQLWKRLGGPIAKKMGISLQAFDRRLYEKSAQGDWTEFADNAKQLKWVDHIITGISDSALRTMPAPANYTFDKAYSEYYGVAKNTPASGNDSPYLARLGPRNFYYLYNPNCRFQLHVNQ